MQKLLKHIRQLHFISVQSNYIKDADKMMHQHNLPLDYPEFIRAKQNAVNASDVSEQH